MVAVVDDATQVLRIWLQFCAKLLGIEDEEVAHQYGGDAHQQAGVEALLVEDAIDIGAVARQAAGKPGHAALLPAQFLLNLVSDVECHGFFSARARVPQALILMLVGCMGEAWNY